MDKYNLKLLHSYFEKKKEKDKKYIKHQCVAGQLKIK